MPTHHTVYRTTNTVNGKIYIGVHCTEDPFDSYLGSGKLISAAIKKYGRAAFVKEVLFDFDTSEEMGAKEAELVDRKFVVRKDTYNLVPGGCQGDSYYQALREVSAEDRKRWSRLGNARRRELLRSDAAFRERHLEHWSKVRTDFSRGENFDWTGRTHTEESRDKMSAASRASSLGSRNSQHETFWVWKGPETRKIPCQDLKTWEDDGWLRGRGPKKKRVRKPRQRGIAHHASKLDWAAVREIRRAYASKEETLKQLGTRFGVSHVSISNVVHHKTWIIAE